jgi:hypothetical protein
LTNVPSTFPPSAHGHTIADVSGLQAALDGKQASGSYATLVGGKVPESQLPPIVTTWEGLTGKPSTFPPSAHSHAIGDVTGLQTALDGKAASSHTHTIANVTGLQSALDAKATPADVTSAVASVVNAAPASLDTLKELADALGNDANFASTVTNAIAGKAATSHGHAIADVTGLQTALDGKQASGSYAADSHGHVISDVTGLQTALDGKSGVSHTHSASDLTSGTLDVARIPSLPASQIGSGVLDEARLPFATTAQARQYQSTTTLISPSTAADAIRGVNVYDLGVGTSTNAGGGSSTLTGQSVFQQASTTAGGSSVHRVSNSGLLWEAGTAAFQQSRVDWSKPKWFLVRVYFLTLNASNGVMRMQWGKDQAATTLGQMDRSGIGFEVRGSRLWLTAHNGSALAAVDSGQNLNTTSAGGSYDILVSSNGTGTVTLWLNGTQVATTTGGPSAAATQDNGFTTEITNGGDSANMSMHYFRNVRFSV